MTTPEPLSHWVERGCLGRGNCRACRTEYGYDYCGVDFDAARCPNFDAQQWWENCIDTAHDVVVEAIAATDLTKLEDAMSTLDYDKLTRLAADCQLAMARLQEKGLL